MHWALIEADAQQHYGLDFSSGILDKRTWRWLSVRILQLLTDNSTRLHKAIYPEKRKG